MSWILTRAFSLAAVALMTVTVGFILSPVISPVHAIISPDGTVVQGPFDTGVQFGNSGSLSFPSPVAKGDVVVVAVVTQFNAQPQSISDSLGSSYKLEVGQCFPSLEGDCSYIYAARLKSAGSDTVSLTKSTTDGFFFFIYDVSGARIHGSASGTGSGSGTAVATSPTSFHKEGFLVAVVESFGGGSLTPGSGFIATSGFFIVSEYSTSGVTSPTTFPGTLASPASWTEVGVAFE